MRSSDCDSNERCVKSVDKSGAPKFVCQLPAEAACAFNTDCAVPLVCAVDMQCRNECLVEADCVRAQRCIHGVCADEEEVTTDGDLVDAIPGAVGPGAGDANEAGGGGAGGESNGGTGGRNRK
jgi:hypothetical protein